MGGENGNVYKKLLHLIVTADLPLQHRKLQFDVLHVALIYWRAK